MAVSWPPEFVEDVRARVDIVDIVAEYVDLRRSGSRYVGLCPFHEERTPSFSVDREKQLFHCFGCQAGGDVFSFVMQKTGASFPQAVEALANRIGLDTTRFASSPRARQRQQRRRELLELHSLVARFFTQVLRSAAGRGARAYLQQRDIKLTTVERFGLGYAPPAEGFMKFMARHGIDEKLALEAGLLSPGRAGRPAYPRFRERLMFPIWDRAGRVIGFGGRILMEGVRAPKYLNSPETPLFRKRGSLYGLHLAAAAARQRGRVIVVEGYTDCLRLAQHGHENVVASLGTAFTEHQARLLRGLAEAAVVAFDADAAGTAATGRSLDLLAGVGLEVGVIQLPDGQDPDDYIRTHGPGAWDQAIDTALPLIEYKLTKALKGFPLDTVDGRVRAVRAAADVLKDIKSPVAREGYVAWVAERTGVRAAVIGEELRLLTEHGGEPVVPRHSMGKIRHNNKGFRGTGNEPTSRGGPRGGERLSYAEQVILRHVLTGHRSASALGVEGPASDMWSSPEVASAVELLAAHGGPDRDVDGWLAHLGSAPGADLLRRIWSDGALAQTPWDDAQRVLAHERGSRRLVRLEDALQQWSVSDQRESRGNTLVQLLLEYKILRSELLGEQA